MEGCKAPDERSPSTPNIYTGTAGEQPEGLPVDLGRVTVTQIYIKVLAVGGIKHKVCTNIVYYSLVVTYKKQAVPVRRCPLEGVD